jgi:hypothetical protein
MKMWKKFRSKKKRRQEQTADVLRLSPEKAAQLLRSLERAGIGDIEIRLLLAKRGQLSDQPGEAASMQKYEEVIRAGRRVRYGTFRAQFQAVTVQVPPELRADVESAFDTENTT